MIFNPHFFTNNCCQRGVLLAKINPQRSTFESLFESSLSSLSDPSKIVAHTLKLNMLVTPLLKYLMPFSLLFGVLAMAAPVGQQGTNNQENTRAEVKGTFLKTEVEHSVPTVKVLAQAAKNAAQTFFTLAFGAILERQHASWSEKSPPPRFAKKWRGSADIVKRNDGSLAQQISVTGLPAMAFKNCAKVESDTRYEVLISWLRQTVSGVWKLADGCWIKIEDNKVKIVKNNGVVRDPRKPKVVKVMPIIHEDSEEKER
ncbi:hypothetical protein FB446DRAFT_713418 [Lentinula raphanica]|nr:hypothetical protein FB446DRAFT_713418 [Lentinula raphanica]